MIRVRSAPGEGSAFEVFLPSAGQELPAVADAPPGRFTGSGCVLVVDDEEIVQRTARFALERAGFSIVVAADGEQAVSVFRERGAGFRLVLLDMTMPVKGGEETLGLLRQMRPDIPVIVSSGFGEGEALQRFGGQADAFLRKPYTVMELARAVKKVLETARSGIK